jgi:hypothetical protein
MHDESLLLLISDINILHAMQPYFQHNKNLLSICISQGGLACAAIVEHFKILVSKKLRVRFLQCKFHFVWLGILFCVTLTFSLSLIIIHLLGYCCLLCQRERSNRGCHTSPEWYISLSKITQWLTIIHGLTQVQRRMCWDPQDYS